ncbi:hypothetical protein BIV25_28410 [Streptomyces sp. MUSC 14]|uniref:putative ATP-grasp-modified RiPP n=1 Tax=Streptomyces sp. MUSC 14 TaxID=1354889 RepID=UPI0008F5EE86|nr:putative ATP-grasp-modified RiPP [Streptomyces sp. MUSC 14]OIJ92262.1 hypothetical protein BIV25_28410 [Streptomyces sp. MUSC 14]
MPVVRPWGLSRMKPYPEAAVLKSAPMVLDPDTQTAQLIGTDGLRLPTMDRHKRSETNTETKPRTSLDGNTDEGSDQQGDTD